MSVLRKPKRISFPVKEAKQKGPGRKTEGHFFMQLKSLRPSDVYIVAGGTKKRLSHIVSNYISVATAVNMMFLVVAVYCIVARVAEGAVCQYGRGSISITYQNACAVVN